MTVVDHMRQAITAMEELYRVRNHAELLVKRLTQNEGEFSDEIREMATDLRIRIWRADNALSPVEELDR